MSRQPKLTADNRPLRQCVLSALDQYFADLKGHEPEDVYHMVIGEVEKAILESVLKQAESNQTRAADMLGINRSTLRKKLKKVYTTEQGRHSIEDALNHIRDVEIPEVAKQIGEAASFGDALPVPRPDAEPAVRPATLREQRDKGGVEDLLPCELARAEINRQLGAGQPGVHDGVFKICAVPVKTIAANRATRFVISCGQNQRHARLAPAGSSSTRRCTSRTTSSCPRTSFRGSGA